MILSLEGNLAVGLLFQSVIVLYIIQYNSRKRGIKSYGIDFVYSKYFKKELIYLLEKPETEVQTQRLHYVYKLIIYELQSLFLYKSDLEDYLAILSKKERRTNISTVVFGMVGSINLWWIVEHIGSLATVVSNIESWEKIWNSFIVIITLIIVVCSFGGILIYIILGSTTIYQEYSMKSFILKDIVSS